MSRIVLVTGVGGFVGSHVVEQLLTVTDWHVIGIDSFAHNGEFVRLLEALGYDTSRVTAIVHDLNAPLSSAMIRRLAGVDYVVNVASRSHVVESIEEPAEFVLNNVRLMVHVLELCRRVQPRHLVHMSTDEVHGPGNVSAAVEHRPSSPYAASKAAQADLVWSYARTYGIPSTVIASANMIGERQGWTAFVPLIVRAAMMNEAIWIDHDVRGRPGERAYTYVRNVASRIVDVLVDETTTPNNGDRDVRYVALRGQRRVDNATLAREVTALLGRPVRTYSQPATDTRPGYDPTYQDIGEDWDPPIEFNDGLARTVDWLARNWSHQEVL